MNISQKLLKLRQKYDLTQSDLSKIAGVSDKTVSTWENGTRDPKLKWIKNICDYYNIDLNSFIDPEQDGWKMVLPNDAIPYNSARYAPILGTIPAGAPVLAVEDIEDYATVPYNDDEDYFYLRVNGESMKGAGIQTGDLVLIRRQPCADDGQIVACRVNGDEATLKRYKRQGNTVLLLPENPDFEPRIVPISDFESGAAEIIGVAVEFRRML